MKRIGFIFVLVLCFGSFTLSAHGNAATHVAEMYSVLPFDSQSNGRATAENQPVAEWLWMITSDLIDNYWGKPVDAFDGKTFYQYLRENFGFRCKHRLLFHWGFNAKPWSDDLEAKLPRYTWFGDADSVAMFKRAFVTEQARRNRQANAETERVFGFQSSGKESAWANGMLAIVYDVHLLGDWVLDDNSDFEGVTPPSTIAGDIVNALRRIDPKISRPMEKALSKITKEAVDEHEMASQMIAFLQQNFPGFLLEANDGALKQKFEAQGFTFKEVGSVPAR